MTFRQTQAISQLHVDLTLVQAAFWKKGDADPSWVSRAKDGKFAGHPGGSSQSGSSTEETTLRSTINVIADEMRATAQNRDVQRAVAGAASAGALTVALAGVVMSKGRTLKAAKELAQAYVKGVGAGLDQNKLIKYLDKDPIVLALLKNEESMARTVKRIFKNTDDMTASALAHTYARGKETSPALTAMLRPYQALTSAALGSREYEREFADVSREVLRECEGLFSTIGVEGALTGSSRESLVQLQKAAKNVVDSNLQLLKTKFTLDVSNFEQGTAKANRAEVILSHLGAGAGLAYAAGTSGNSKE